MSLDADDQTDIPLWRWLIFTPQNVNARPRSIWEGTGGHIALSRISHNNSVVSERHDYCQDLQRTKEESIELFETLDLT